MIGGKPIDLNKTYRVSSWGGNLQNAGENLAKETPAVYDVVSDYIRKKKVIDISMESNVKVLDYACGCPQKGAKC
jgi:sulfur-oxidizing protein SoxB